MAETIKARIQLKCDTEANWNKSVLVSEGGVEKTTGTSFIPRKGEVIIYEADDTHPFSRLKVGDGVTNVVRLPFSGSRNINNIIFEEKYINFPPIGENNMLYVAIDSFTIYKWEQGNYTKLYEFHKQQISSVSNWHPGEMTELTVNNGMLNVFNGTIPTLSTSNVEVLTDFS